MKSEAALCQDFIDKFWGPLLDFRDHCATSNISHPVLDAIMNDGPPSKLEDIRLIISGMDDLAEKLERVVERGRN